MTYQKESAKQRSCYYCGKTRPWRKLVEMMVVFHSFDPPDADFVMVCNEEAGVTCA